MAVVTIESIKPGKGEQEAACCRALEEGHVLLFSRTPFELPEADRAFLLRQRQVESGYHKNIVYRPGEDRVSNFVQQQPGDDEALRRVLRRYSQQAVAFVAALLPRYAQRWRIDYASFRPQEEAGRQLPLRARNDLLHVDAFPTRPTRGDRILRIFTNINPTAPRVWVTGETFEELAGRFAVSSGLLEQARRTRVRNAMRRLARSIGLPVVVRSPYDEFMLKFHHFLKENGDYQQAARKLTTEFPPGATWMVFTDMVSHAVLRGQYALEQTFIVARDSLALPEKAPITVLERIAGAAMN